MLLLLDMWIDKERSEKNVDEVNYLSLLEDGGRVVKGGNYVNIKVWRNIIHYHQNKGGNQYEKVNP